MKLPRFLTGPLIALVLAAFMPAAHAGSWTGCYVGVQGGYAIAAHEVGIGGVFTLDGISSEGVQGGPVVGCDWQASDRIVLGAFADYAFRSVDTGVSLGGASASIGLDNAWSVGARAGVLVAPQTLVYGLAVYQRTDVDDAGTGLVSSLNGIGGGGGIEVGLAPGWSVRGEYRYVAYDGESIAGIATIDTDEHQVRAGLVWRFYEEK